MVVIRIASCVATGHQQREEEGAGSPLRMLARCTALDAQQVAVCSAAIPSAAGYCVRCVGSDSRNPWISCYMSCGTTLCDLRSIAKSANTQLRAKYLCAYIYTCIRRIYPLQRVYIRKYTEYVPTYLSISW